MSLVRINPKALTPLAKAPVAQTRGALGGLLGARAGGTSLLTLASSIGAFLLLASSELTAQNPPASAKPSMAPAGLSAPVDVVQTRPLLTLGVDQRATNVRFDEEGTLHADVVQRVTPHGESYARLRAPQMTLGSEWRMENDEGHEVSARVEGCGTDVALRLLDGSGAPFGSISRNDETYLLQLGDRVFQSVGVQVDGTQQLTFKLTSESHGVGLPTGPWFTLLFHANNAITEKRGFSVRVLNTQGLSREDAQHLSVAAPWMMAYMLHRPVSPVSGPSGAFHVGNRLATLAGRIPEESLASVIFHTTPACP
ncbi:MAG: hypothetical protein ACKVPX_11020 [Myxococcaceae bacterium]